MDITPWERPAKAVELCFAFVLVVVFSSLKPSLRPELIQLSVNAAA